MGGLSFWLLKNQTQKRGANSKKATYIGMGYIATTGGLVGF